MNEQIMRPLMCNAIYAGVRPFPALADDETWLQAVVQMTKKEDLEQFLVIKLYVLRQSLETGVGETKDREGDWILGLTEAQVTAKSALTTC